MTLLFLMLFSSYNFGNIEDVIGYDNYVLTNLSSSPKFTSYLIDKDVTRSDEPRFKVRVSNRKFNGLSFINYETGIETFTNLFPIEDGYYFLISQKTLMRLTAIKSLNEIKVTCDYKYTCECKCETKEVVKVEYKTEIKYQKEINWWYVVGGTILGFIAGGIVGYNL
jgi:hypothetical protein